MAYCVFTCKKPKTGAADGGLSAHIDREKWDGKEHKMVPFVPDSVIHPELSHLNKEYLLPPGMGRTEAINKRIMEAGITRKIRDDQAKFLAFLCSSDRETMLRIYNEGRWQAWVDANISFMQKTFGKDNVVGCAGHMDEVTFHLHFTVVPILAGQAAERPDTKKQFEKRNGKEKRRYKKQEVTARLCAKDVFTPANAEQWQTDYALHMQAAGFDLQRGEVGSQAKHMDPAVYNSIKAEEAKLIAEKDGLEMQKEVLEDEVDTLQSEKDALVLDVDILNKEKKQAELQTITDKVNRYNVAYVRFDVPKVLLPVPKITERPPRFGNIDEWQKTQNACIKEQFRNSLKTYGETVMQAAQNCIVSERKLYLKQQNDMSELGDNLRRAVYLRQQQSSDVAGLLSLFEKPDTAKLVREIAVALMGGHYVSIPCAGGGSVSSETGWDGRKKDEEDENFRLRCWLHAAKTVKASHNVQTRRKGCGMG